MLPSSNNLYDVMLTLFFAFTCFLCFAFLLHASGAASTARDGNKITIKWSHLQKCATHSDPPHRYAQDIQASTNTSKKDEKCLQLLIKGRLWIIQYHIFIQEYFILSRCKCVPVVYRMPSLYDIGWRGSELHLNPTCHLPGNSDPSRQLGDSTGASGRMSNATFLLTTYSFFVKVEVWNRLTILFVV